MKILLIGSGGREHALAWKINQSPLTKKLYCAPGNGGIADIAECVDIQANEIDQLLAFAKKNKIDLTVVGPEAPLVEGIVDVFEEAGLKIFGPNKMAAQLEGSKVLAKEFLQRCNIPTAQFRVYNRIDEAKDFLTRARFPLVIKADGLASGKGVFICKDILAAEEALNQIMKQKIFQDAGKQVIIEECLEGEEASILVISDGNDYVILESSQDHKRLFDDDLGPNTGGMGAYSPAPVIDEDILEKIDTRIIDPTIRGMKRDGAPFKGVLYVGLMLTQDGPFVLEYNVRFGDPETQAVIPRLKTDIVKIFQASCDGKMKKMQLEWEDKACVCVVMSSGGYPGEYEKGKEIHGLDKIINSAERIIFHAGTEKKGENILTSGGRVLGVTALGEGISKAIGNAYEAVEQINFEKCFFRRDIGAKALIHLGNPTRLTRA